MTSGVRIGSSTNSSKWPPKIQGNDNLLGELLLCSETCNTANQEAFAVRYATLTPRERQVLALLVRGLLNKQAGFELGITEYTVQIHRAHIMRKMEADSFATLVKLTAKFVPCA